MKRRQGTRIGNSNMNGKPPTVSVCLPVYNGATYLREALQSILVQSFADIELVISDNASTDATEDICRDTVARDSRVRYYRSPVNRGLAWNFNHAFAQARGRYLVWIGHDDVMAKEYLGRCVGTLESDPEAVLCYTNATYIDANGCVTKRLEMSNPAASERSSDRFHHILYDWMCDPICGLMKTEVLKKTRLFGNYADHDRVLLAEMGLRGRFSLVGDYLFSRRMHAEQSTKKYRDLRERTLFYDPARAGTLFFPVLQEAWNLATAIHRANLPWNERLRSSRFLARWLWEQRDELADDLREGLLSILSMCLPEDQVQRLKLAKRRIMKACFG
jgi:glycosyltransferase involved in cell wall biosynthesis